MKPFLNLLLLSFFTLNLWAQNTNDVTLTVVGSGKTIEEAKTNALRSAIEQAYGAFVSSNTEILNDEIVKDEIVSISSGNIKEFKILSQSELMENLVSMTLSATVSVSSLQSYAQSKGATVEFAGGLFAMNIKIQKLNEEAEWKAVQNLCELTYQRFKSCFDFKIETKDPTFVEENKYLIEYSVAATTNNNFKLALEYLISTLETLKMSSSDISKYLELKKPVYTILLPYENEMNKYGFQLLGCYEDKINQQASPFWDDRSCIESYVQLSFRNIKSVQVLQNLIVKSNVFPISFEINRLNEKICPFIIGKTENQEWLLFDGIQTSSIDYKASFQYRPNLRTYQYVESPQGYGFPAVMFAWNSRYDDKDFAFLGSFGAGARSTLSYFFLHIGLHSYRNPDSCFNPRAIAADKCGYFESLNSDFSKMINSWNGPRDVPPHSFILSRATEYEYTAVCKEYMSLDQLEKISEITVEPIYK